MRCPDCQKFAAFDAEVDPEGDLEIDDQGMMTGEVHRALKCADCSTELKAYDFQIDKDLVELIDLPDTASIQQKVCQHDWEWEHASWSMSPTDRYEDKDRHGNKIKHNRFMRHMYGVDINGEVTCHRCQVVVQFNFAEEEQSSAFEEQV